MNPIAAIFDTVVLYRYSLVLALAAAAGICFFMACCSRMGISMVRGGWTALCALVFSLLLSRLIYWYGRPDSFDSFHQALTDGNTEEFALIGAFAGCALSAMLFGQETRWKVLDCMCVAGSFAIALGRLGSFFTASDRGQIMQHLTGLPWAFPVVNASGNLEHRFATFLFQAIVAAILGVILLFVLLKSKGNGNVSILFVLIYCASQVLLDSTRYDSLYFRSNGFVSIVQVVSAVALAIVFSILSVRLVQFCGLRKWMIPVWIFLLLLFGGAGYMEYYVQRHGREAAFSYSIMGICLFAMIGLGVWMLVLIQQWEQNKSRTV